jgi:hypothetical protein
MPTPAEQTTTTTTAADPSQTATTPEAQSATPVSFETWLEGQDETVKGLIAARFEKLETTVRTTRDERDNFSKQIKTLAKQQAEGSEAKAQLEQLGAQLEETERRAAFLEEAFNPALQCRNPRAAWTLAKAQDLFDKKGNPDWAALKREAPELFGVPVANANAGNGTGKPPATKNDMNSWIRRTAGRE